MSIYDWKPQYSVGDPTLDGQHQRLFTLLGKMHESMSSGHAKDAVEPILNQPAAYVGTHFANDERVMREVSYPDLIKNQRVHHRMTAALEKLVGRYRAGEIRVMELQQFLVRWLQEHILETDVKYAPFVKNRRVA